MNDEFPLSLAVCDGLGHGYITRLDDLAGGIALLDLARRRGMTAWLRDEQADELVGVNVNCCDGDYCTQPKECPHVDVEMNPDRREAFWRDLLAT